ncbi:MAG: glycosyltransferase [Lachnospiraceae bacterium]|nr:glycosyltransferase [Lachnospiraceae bacterium]
MKMYEQLYLLGMKHYYDNVNQAYLCMEQSLFLCDDAEDKPEIAKLRDELKSRPGFCVRPVSAVVVSYNDLEWMQVCLQSFRDTMPEGTWEMIAVDNQSSDGADEWLEKQPDVRLIRNPGNMGFSIGCNVGFSVADPGNDILLINNDAVLTPNALFFLRMALYESRDVGAVGAVSNYASEQNADEEELPWNSTLEETVSFSKKTNIPMSHPYEARSRLTGFAVLIARECCDQVAKAGYLLDPLFSPAYFEDDDLGIRIALAGYRQLLVHNALIYHKGGTPNQQIGAKSREKFVNKWGFDIWKYTGVMQEYEQAVKDFLAERGNKVSDDRLDGSLRVLEIDCGMGVNLAHLQYLYPDMTVIGIEREPIISAIASRLIRVLCGTPEEVLANVGSPDTEESYILKSHTFDLIFAWDACSRSQDPDAMRAALRGLLKPEGRLIEIE